ncbi:MAG: T9SS type A sorting domain-containing protein [Bacteroidetes bacterium]|nr:T9SS type A sorting domain-containing protein [Bacteroidota bacterium]
MKRVLSLCLVLINLQPNEMYSQSVWQWEHPLPTGNTMNSLYFFNSPAGIAAGSKGNILKTTDGGMSWELIHAGVSKSIFKILFIDGLTGICAGKDGLLLKTSDAGKSWTAVESNTVFDIYDICLSGGKLFCCGLNGYLGVSSDSGESWMCMNSQINIPLFCISFIDEDTGVCGGYGKIIGTKDAGKNWEILNADVLPSTQVNNIQYISSDKIYAAGNSPQGDFYISTDGGNNWEINSLGLPFLFGGTVDLVKSMDFIDSSRGIIVTDPGTVLITSDGGNSWQRDTSQRHNYLKSEILKEVFYNDSGNIFLCGSGGRIITKSPDSESWNILTGNNNDICGSFVCKNGTIFSAGENGSLLRKKPDNPEWEMINICDKTNFRSVFFINEFSGFLCSDDGKVFRTTDEGNTWNEININLKNILMNRIIFTDKYTGYIAGGFERNSTGLILKTTDSGDNWKIVFNNNGNGVFRDIFFNSDGKGFAVGAAGNLSVTADGGNSWIFKSLIPYDLNSVKFDSSNKGIIAGSNGTVFISNDGGDNWNYITPVQYNDLYSAEFISGTEIIAAGKNGTLIISTDGGNVWNKLNSITDNNLNSVNSDGKHIYAFGDNGAVISSEIIPGKNLSGTGYERNTDENEISGYPNPFNVSAVIRYQLHEPGSVSLKVYDNLGNEVKVLVQNKQMPGRYKVIFDGSGFPSGVYFYRLETGVLVKTGKFILLK